MLIRSRLQEHYGRIIKEDMLTVFGKAAKLKNLECAILLQGAQLVSQDLKYKAACVLEILTGQKVTGESCNVGFEDPQHKKMTREQKKLKDQMRSAALLETKLKAKGVKAGTAKSKKVISSLQSEISSDLKKMGSGLKLWTVLEKGDAFVFLEKLREFYQPDTIASGRAPHRVAMKGMSPNNPIAQQNSFLLARDDGVTIRRPLERGHSNMHDRRALLGHFEEWTAASRLVQKHPENVRPPRQSIDLLSNPTEACTTYLLKSMDILKFPDIELHFESISSVLTRSSSSFSDVDESSSTIQIILRPTLQIINHKIESEYLPPVDNIKVMNYFLSQFFNPYLTRPRVSN